MSKLLNVSSSPHVRSSVSTQNLMYDVAIAMLPATIWGVMQFGFYSLVVVAATVLSCVLSEYVFETLMKKPITISDGSALVTGMILGLNMPPTIPLCIPVLGGMFAIYELLPAFLCALIAIVVVSLLTKAPEQEIVDEFEAVSAEMKQK